MADESLPLVLPVRFAGGGLSMQTTTGRLSLQSAVVRCLVAPKQGARVQLSLTVPGAPRPLEIAGVVTGHSAEKQPGFDVRFDPLKAEVRGHLEKLLAAQGEEPAPAAARPPRTDAEPPGSKRVYARLPMRLQVGWSTPREFLVAYSENISRGGIFVAIRHPPPLGEIVELLLELPDGDPPAKTNAQVVQSVTEETARASRRTAGAGLQFVGGDDEFRRRLDQCIEHLLAQETT